MEETAPKCKICGTTLKPPNLDKAEKDFENGELKGFCPTHDWQVLTADEQALTMRMLQSG